MIAETYFRVCVCKYKYIYIYKVNKLYEARREQQNRNMCKFYGLWRTDIQLIKRQASEHRNQQCHNVNENQR